MPRFRYQARDPRGEPIAAEREAAGAPELVASLAAEGLTDVVVFPLVDSAVGRLSAGETREFAYQVAGMTQAGLPLASGLKALALDLPASRLRDAVSELAARTESGESLDEALEGMGPRFPGHLRGLLQTGVKSGHTGEVLSQFIDYARVGSDLKRALLMSLAYPVLLVGLFLLLLFLLCMYLVQSFEAIFNDFGVNLPLMTRLLVRLSHQVTFAGWSVLLTPLIAVAVGVVAVKLLLDAPTRRRLLCAIPIVGPLWRWTALAEFSHYLGMLIDSRIPLPQAVPLAAEGTGDAQLQVASHEMARRLKAGLPLAEATEAGEVIPGAFRKVLRWAEGHQSLPETLHMVGELFEAQARARATFAGAVLGIAAVIIVTWGVMFLVIGLFLPLITLINALS